MEFIFKEGTSKIQTVNFFEMCLKKFSWITILDSTNHSLKHLQFSFFQLEKSSCCILEMLLLKNSFECYLQVPFTKFSTF